MSLRWRPRGRAGHCIAERTSSSTVAVSTAGVWRQRQSSPTFLMKRRPGNRAGGTRAAAPFGTNSALVSVRRSPAPYTTLRDARIVRSPGIGEGNDS